MQSALKEYVAHAFCFCFNGIETNQTISLVPNTRTDGYPECTMSLASTKQACVVFLLLCVFCDASTIYSRQSGNATFSPNDHR